MNGGCSMTEHCCPAAGKDGSKEPAFAGQSLVAHRVDAAPDGMEPAGPDTPSDRVLVEAERQQLVHRDEAMLACGYHCDLAFGEKVAHIATKSPSTLVRPLYCPSFKSASSCRSNPESPTGRSSSGSPRRAAAFFAAVRVASVGRCASQITRV